MFIERTSVGLDVHARSIVACGLDTATGQVMRRRLVPSAGAVLDWLRELSGPVAVAYEAGATGFGLARQLTADQRQHRRGACPTARYNNR